MLALDGGGIRGVLSIEVLSAIEQQLRNHLGKPRLVLADYFDYIAGTSTGAVIATALAIGKSTEEVRELYEGFARKVFIKSMLGRFALVAKYQRLPLERALKDTFGMQRLGSQELKTMLLVVVRNVTTDSAWPISNNPYARYNERSRSDCNLEFPLWKLVRASTAAPTYFAPEVIPMYRKTGTVRVVFADGGTTSYNNPAFLLYRMATQRPYWHLGQDQVWPRGERKLLLVSVGTGLSPLESPGEADVDRNQLSDAIDTLRSFVYQTTVDQDIACRTVGRCTFGGILDRDLDRLIPGPQETAARDFTYARYNVELTAPALRELRLGHIDPRSVSGLDAVKAIPQLQEIGRKVGELVDLEKHFTRVFLDTGKGPNGNAAPAPA